MLMQHDQAKVATRHDRANVVTRLDRMAEVEMRDDPGKTKVPMRDATRFGSDGQLNML